MENIRPLVLIPLHKSEPSANEVISLVQCARVFKNRDIAILCPDNISLEHYKTYFPSFEKITVDPFWMASVRSYNKLMSSPWIWTQCDQYSHLLIHEPDAIALRDDLDYWCLRNYDYIGAPWLEGWDFAKPDANIIAVGNFGFSLHRLDFHRALLSSGVNTHWFNYLGNCDLFWSFEASKHYQMSIAPFEEAVQFAWEAAPARCYEISGKVTPFGIHAWARYDLDFVKPFLEEAGVLFA